MKKSFIAAMLIALLLGISACGNSSEPSDVSDGGMLLYEAPAGWSVEYDSEHLKVTETDNGAIFEAADASDSKDTLEIAYLEGKQSREALTEVLGDIDPEEVIYTEHMFMDKYWSYSASIYEDAASTSYTCIEHNGGAIVMTTSIDMTEQDGTIEMALNEAEQTFTFTGDHEEIEFVGTFGTYEVESAVQDAPTVITLNEDHTGTLTYADSEAEITWDSTKVWDTNNGSIVEYTIEGDMLMLNVGDDWVTYIKK